MAYAERFEYENAAEVRNQINALSAVLHQQAVESVGNKGRRHSGSEGVGDVPASTWPWCGAGGTWVIGPVPLCMCRTTSWLLRSKMPKRLAWVSHRRPCLPRFCCSRPRWGAGCISGPALPG